MGQAVGVPRSGADWDQEGGVMSVYTVWIVMVVLMTCVVGPTRFDDDQPLWAQIARDVAWIAVVLVSAWWVLS